MLSLSPNADSGNHRLAGVVPGTAIVLFAAATLWLALCTVPAFAAWLRYGLERQYPPHKASTYPSADVIVVLGGGQVPRFDNDRDEDATPTTRAGLGLELFHKGRAPIILLSGTHHEAMQMVRVLEQQGVPVTSLLMEDASMNTHQNALYSAAILKREKLQRILLVTSSMHMPRAAASFKRQGLTVIPASTFNPKPKPQNASRWLPRRNMLRESGNSLREYVGLWIYRLRGWA